MDFPGSSHSKESACNMETWVRFLDWEDPQEERMAIHFNILAWRIPQREEPSRLHPMVLQRVRHDWVTNSVQFSHSVVSDSLWPHGLQHTRLPCPSPAPRIAQTHVHQVSDAIQPSHPLLSPSPPAFNLSQHQGLFQWVNSLHEVAKVLALQHQSFQRIFRTDFL